MSPHYRSPYRYTLARHWATGEGSVLWIMLNPSTADHITDDPTIRRCIRFSQDWGYRSLEVVNLFALRATNPTDLLIEPCTASGGWRADNAIACGLDDTDLVVCAWGVIPRPLRALQRDRDVLDMIRGRIKLASVGRRAWPHNLGLTKEGFPRHPLYLAADTSTRLWLEEMP